MKESFDSAPSERLLRAVDVRRRHYENSDRKLFDEQLRDFVPSDSFDAHSHLYDLRHLLPHHSGAHFAGSPQIGDSTRIACMQQWMGDRVSHDGLFFAFPIAKLDSTTANAFVLREVQQKTGSRALMLIRPEDDPSRVDQQLRRDGCVGFKVYHVFAARSDTQHAEIGEFLPDWVWDLANQMSLAITLHLVRPRAVSDELNQRYIQQKCREFPHAKLILAHAARGFNSHHTVTGIKALRGLSNLWFDTSAICEPAAFEAIIESFGPTRLLYGSDFPVSEMRGRCVSIADGFFWLHDDNACWDNTFASPSLVGLESLLALRQACRTMRLVDRDIERIFGENARQLFSVDRSSAGNRAQDAHASNPSDVHQLYRHAKTRIPGGTQLLSKRPEMFAPERWPAYYEQAIGCEVVDTDGHRYIDMSHCGILSCPLGFADPDVNDAVIRRIHLGSMATQQTADEVELAERLTTIHPWADQARFTRSGGEAMAVAVRIARAATGRSKLAVCGYHGWHDWYLAANLPLANAGRRDLPLDAHLLPGLEANGVPSELAGTVFTFAYNDLSQLQAALAQCGDDLAAIVMEPTRSIDPDPGFLETVRQRATDHNAALVFDEISSAWRQCLGGAHLLYGVQPDLAVFAKGMSNGFAMGAVIGQKEFMQACHTTFISSTYWTEGIGPAASLATIKKMQRVDLPSHLKRIGQQVLDGWKTLALKHQLSIKTHGRPDACRFVFDHPENAALQTLLTCLMLQRGYLATGTCLLTLAHDELTVNNYLIALDEVFGEISAAVRNDTIQDRLNSPVKHSGFQRLVN